MSVERNDSHSSERVLDHDAASFAATANGRAIVEMAVVLPLILALLIGLWEVARMIQVLQLMSTAAREGARAAATTQSTNAQVTQLVLNCLNSQSVPTQNVAVTVQDLSSPTTDALNAAPLDQLQVTVSIPFSDVRWVTLSLVTSPTTMLTAQATWYAAEGIKPTTHSPTPDRITKVRLLIIERMHWSEDTMQGHPRRMTRSRSGASAVEMALILPIFFLLTFGVMEYGRYVMYVQVATNAARGAARLAATGTNTESTSDIQNLANSLLGGLAFVSPPVIQVYHADVSGNNIGNWSDTPFGGGIAVKIDGDYPIMLPGLGILPSSVHIRALSVVQSEAN